MSNPVNELVSYVKASKEELRKVTWPSKQQTRNYTLVVLALSVFTMVFFSVLDYFFDFGVTFLTRFAV